MLRMHTSKEKESISIISRKKKGKRLCINHLGLFMECIKKEWVGGGGRQYVSIWI